MRILTRRRSRRWAAPTAKETRVGQDEVYERECIHFLRQNYPGHAWRVHSHCMDQVVDVYHMELSHDFGYRINLRTDDVSRKIGDAAGRLLEMYNIRRGKWDEAAMASLKRNARGEVFCVQ